MFWLILCIVSIIPVALKIYNHTRNNPRPHSRNKKMSQKYPTLLTHILKGRKNCRIIKDSEYVLEAGVSDCEGSATFCIRQCNDNTLTVEYIVNDNPSMPEFKLAFRFPDNMDQNEIMIKLAQDIQAKFRDLKRPVTQ